MPGPQALVTWPGVNQFIALQGTLQHGVTPSVFTLTIAPQKGKVAPRGDLVITFGNTKIKLKDCTVDAASYQFDEGGFLIGLQILDRRWKWRFGKISGVYNATDDAGQILTGVGPNDNEAAVKNSERTPKQLAEKCLKAMKEEGYSVADLPNESRPKIEWDYANPSKALADLCESCGCRVVLGLDNKVRIKKLSVGSPLPNLPFVDAQLDIDPAEKPDNVTIVTAPVQVQADFKLEAVGLETDGTIKPIDELSYKPIGGWTADEPESFVELTDADDPEVRNLALESVYRWYRIELDKDIVIPTGDGKEEKVPLLHREQIELLPLQIDRDAINGEKRQVRRESWVYGVWFIPDPKDWMSTSTTERGNSADSESYIERRKDARLVTIGFSIDTEHRLVKFGEPVYRQNPDGTGTFLPALLRLRTAVNIRKAATGELIRMEVRKPTPGQKQTTEDMIILRNDLEPTLIQRYTAQSNALMDFGFIRDNTESNSSEIIAAAKVYAEHAIRELGIETPESRKYPGIIAIEPDGALQAISWSISESGAFTKIHRNHDQGSETAIPYKMRRQMERRAAFQKAVAPITEELGKGVGLLARFLTK